MEIISRCSTLNNLHIWISHLSLKSNLIHNYNKLPPRFLSKTAGSSSLNYKNLSTLPELCSGPYPSIPFGNNITNPLSTSHLDSALAI